jgi:tripartite-type tricarboxylate transporter receptor subunit TctC
MHALDLPATASLRKSPRRSGALAQFAASALMALAIPVLAQPHHDKAAHEFQNKSIRLIVPFPPGGPMDLTVRALSTRLGERLGQPVVVAYRPGANGNIGSEIAARSAPDGHTILLAAPSLVINPSLYRLGFNPQKELRGLTQLTRGDIVLVAHPSLPAKTPAELVSLARQRPGVIAFGSLGNGSQSHLAGEMLKQATGVELTHVPPKGSASAMTELLGGRIAIMFDAAGAALPHIGAGRLRAFANASSQRSSLLPDLPSLAETFSGVCIDGWQGLLVPAATPPPTVERLQPGIAAVLALPDSRQGWAQIGFEVVASTADEFDRFMLIEYTRYAWLISAANIRLD